MTQKRLHKRTIHIILQLHTSTMYTSKFKIYFLDKRKFSWNTTFLVLNSVTISLNVLGNIKTLTEDDVLARESATYSWLCENIGSRK